MIDGLIRFSLQNRAAVIFAALLACAWGVWRAANVPIDVFPDLTAPTVTILCEGPGMSPSELETRVTFPIESAVNGGSGVRRIRSATHPGISVIWVEFDWEVGAIEARRVVTEKLGPLVAELPMGVTPILAPRTSLMGEVRFLGVTSQSRSAMDIRSFVDTTLKRRLLAVPGVSQVTVLGGDRKQYQVKLAPTRLQSYEVTFEDVREALAADNRNVSAGFRDAASAEYIVTGRGRFREINDIESVVVRETNGAPVLVRDIAEVVIAASPKRGEGSANGKRAVIVGVQKQPGANTIALAERLDATIADVERSLPKGMTLEKSLFRQSEFIEVAVQNVVHALRDGGILVVIIMILFLASLRASAITLTAIPLSLVAAVLVLESLGATFNTMTLGGMAIAIGALVDDAVIDVENVVRRLRQNSVQTAGKKHSFLHIVFEASKEIRGSITFATVIVVAVFLPVFFLPGVEGRLLRPLGTAYSTLR